MEHIKFSGSGARCSPRQLQFGADGMRFQILTYRQKKMSFFWETVLLILEKHAYRR